jgi:acyl-CoA thioester hydrolase
MEALMPDYSRTFEVRWADLDPNFHMRHTAYNDYAAHVRFAFLTELGFSLEEFRKHHLGPVLFKETTEFLREVRAGERITVNLLVAGASEDGRKFRIRHEILKSDGVKAAVVTVEGAWLDTEKRKVVPAPPALQRVMAQFPRSEDFVEI